MSVPQELYICKVCKTYLRKDELERHECCGTSSTTQPDVNPQSEDDITEVIIGLVHAKRPLWDHRLPISQRGRNEKDKLWSEIWKEMGGMLTMENLQKKWKNLRDQFVKTKGQVDTYVHSGSATPAKKKVWKHYESLKFLTDTVQPKQTSSNLKSNSLLSSPSPSASTISEENIPEVPSPASSVGKKRRRKTEHFEESLLSILENPIKVSELPQQQVCPSMVMASSLLEKLPMRVRMRAEREFLNQLYDLIDEFVDQE